MASIQDLIRDSRNIVINELYDYCDEELGHVFQKQLTVERYKGREDKSFSKITTRLAEEMAKKLDNMGSRLRSEYHDLLIKIATLNKFEVKLNAENLSRASFSDEELAILKELKLYQYLIPVSQDTTGHYTPVVADDNAAKNLQSYTDIGNLFKENPTKRHEEFIKMIDEIVNPVSEDDKNRHTKKVNPYFPYVFISCSSGTGKTQLPFSLAKYPILYFITKEAADRDAAAQPIYQNFKTLSTHLFDVIESDIKTFRKQYFKFKIKKAEVFSMPTINDSRMVHHRYHTCGFIVGLLKKILEQASTSQDQSNDQLLAMPKNWLQSEIDCPAFDYKGMTIIEAKEELSKMFGKIDPEVLVFMDEVTEMLEPSLRLLRSLMRSIRLVFVIMGTNAKAEDFVRSNNFTGSRIGNVPWCYFVYRLPPVCSTYIDREQVEVNKLVAGSNIRLQKFVNLLFKLLPKERPLFVIQTCELLKRSLPVPDLTDIALLEQIVKELFTEFVNAKLIFNQEEFYKGQIDFLDPRPVLARSVTFIPKHVACFDPRVIETVKGDSGCIKSINQNDDGKIYLQVVYNDVSLTNHGAFKLRYIRGTDFISLDMKSVMPEFHLEPFTGLSFSGAHPVLDKFFLLNNETRTSCLKKYYALFTPLPLQNQHKRAQLDGMYLEKAAAMAMILASHAASIGSSLKFETFFAHFIRELQDDYQDKPVVTCEKSCKDLWSIFSKIRVPYCATISAKWNQELYEHLTESGCLLGTVNETESGDAVDVMMYCGNDESDEFMSVECRLHRDNVDVSQLNAKTNSLVQRKDSATGSSPPTDENQTTASSEEAATAAKPAKPPPRINILLVRQLADMKGYSDVIPRLDQHRIWLVKLVKTLSGSYLLQSVHRPDNVERIYIMMDLHTTAPQTSLLINAECKKLKAAKSAKVSAAAPETGLDLATAQIAALKLDSPRTEQQPKTAQAAEPLLTTAEIAALKQASKQAPKADISKTSKQAAIEDMEEVNVSQEQSNILTRCSIS